MAEPSITSSVSNSEKRHRRPQKKRRLRVPAPLVFLGTIALAIPSYALVFLKGDGFLGFSVGACLFILFVLIVDERSNFSRTKRAPRTGETRINLNKVEIGILFVLLILGIFVCIHALLT